MTNKGPVSNDNHLFITSFSHLKDYRRTTKGNLKFSLNEIIFLTLSAVISGFNTYELIAEFGKYEIDWLRKFFPYEKETPSHDTLGEFYSKINPKEFANCMISFMKGLKKVDSDLVSLDGKTVRGFLDENDYPLHILTAFCNKNRMTLGEELVEQGKENEIVVIPKLLKLLCLRGCVVSIDAMGCQTKIAEQIVDQGGDYLLQVKANQKGLLENIEDSFSLLKPLETATTEEVGHGRVEIRKYLIINNLELIEQKQNWENLYTLIKVESEVYHKKTGETSVNERFYISSKHASGLEFGSYIRGHWEIESMHWSLDVIFGEDFQTKRNKNGILNFNTLSKCAISLLVEEKTFPKSKPLKQQRAFAKREYRELILNV
jgi:predicted transposase YbfD/YdcC